jgi:hypothetical protein
MKKILMLSIIVGFISSCSILKTSGGNNTVTLSGKVSTLGMSTFQYGTHLIKVENKTYALKSSKVHLDTYVDKSVVLKGSIVPGYPLEGGAELIEVSEIRFSK